MTVYPEPPSAEIKAFTPALGVRALTPLYDSAIALLTRENIWRSALIEAIALQKGERLLDVGCGTGSLAVRL
ncbi:MAG: class I SAM-dependent methyltransferase, partial [Hyphomonadaceae bacterium]|nr:class I SAM-dependent methyltransferase [Hyphomonadaceae bacterium]MBY0422311.1 class I SAM-dependent methyltransferase [Parvularculaceae bacterium]